jgi:hydroxymethyl cephem carbamoyltransferase
MRRTTLSTIVGVKPGHDGAVAVIRDGRLEFSLEAEKDSGHRYADLDVSLLLKAMSMLGTSPDVLAVGGWHRWVGGRRANIGAGYFGIGRGTLGLEKILGHDVLHFTSSHERSHVMAAVGLYPAPLPEEFVVLVWEGRIGSFYVVRERGLELRRIPVMDHPGGKFSALMALADPTFPDLANPRHDYAGKLMALAAYGDVRNVTSEDCETIERLLCLDRLFPFDKGRFRGVHLYGCGVDDDRFRAAAKVLSDRIFEEFARVAVTLSVSGPLLVAGGCGLNCDWNTAWVRSGIFSDVFVPPCANDSGSAIGTAVDAMLHLGEDPTLAWSVDAGEGFLIDNEPDAARWTRYRYQPVAVARAIAGGRVVAWVNGRYEIGPRALGRRSLLAAGDISRNLKVLNDIKRREAYRPIAPCCRAEDFDIFFDGVADEYMLYFARVRDPRLAAITHVDGSARVQLVEPATNPPLHSLLTVVGEHGGLPVLCNTSLNFHGRGFINRMSDLVDYCEENGVTDMVVDDRYYLRRDLAEARPCD